MHDSNSGIAGPPSASQEDAALTDGQPSEPPTSDETVNHFSALRDDLTALVEDARTYTQAEIAFQKTRASLAGKHGARSVVALILALVLLNIALIALAVGAVIALAPLVTIWGAIAIVVGILLAGVAALVGMALGDGRKVGAMFSADKDI